MNHQITFKTVDRVLKNNGFRHTRTRGSHFIYIKDGHTLVVNLKINACVWNRLVKEHQLI